MNHDLLDYLLKTLLDMPHADRTPKKIKAALDLVAGIAGVKTESRVAAQQRNSTGPKTADPSSALIRIDEVSKIIGLARATIYKLLNNPKSKFPRPIKLTDGVRKGTPVAWVRAEVQDWVHERAKTRCEYSARAEE